MQLLRQADPDAELFYIMGADSLNDLPAWHAPQEFLSACDGLLVMHREQEEVVIGNLENSLPGITPKIHLLASPVVDISSREIRERITQERSVRYLIPDGVLSIITENNLYQ
jgi:nicotinate-nucleotide adenylyltransferase